MSRRARRAVLAGPALAALLTSLALWLLSQAVASRAGCRRGDEQL